MNRSGTLQMSVFRLIDRDSMASDKNYAPDKNRRTDIDLPVCCSALRTGDDLVTSAGLLCEVLALRSRSTMNFFVFGCPAGDTSLPCFTALTLGEYFARGDLLTSGDLTAKSADLTATFGLTFGDADLVPTNGDICPTFGVLLGDAFLELSAPFTQWEAFRGNERCVAVVKSCFWPAVRDGDVFKSCSVSPAIFSEHGLNVYCSRFAADDSNCLLAGDWELRLLSDNLEAEERTGRHGVVLGDDLWPENPPFCSQTDCWCSDVFSGVAPST